MKNKMYGWQKVYGFSIKQRLKGKGFRIAIAVLFLIALISLPIMSILGERGKDVSINKSKIETVYVNDHDLHLADAIKQLLLQSDKYSHIKINEVSDDSQLKELETKTSDNIYVDVVVEQGVQYSGYYGESENVTKSDAQSLLKYLSDHSKEMLLYSKGFDRSTAEKLAMDYSYDMKSVAMGSSGMEIVKNKAGLNFSEYGFSYGVLMASLFLIMIGSGSVANDVVTEKSTRVIEYLLINLKPLDIVLGKILSAVTAVFLELVAVIAGLGCSVIANGYMFPSEDGSFALPQMVKSFLNGSMFEKTSALGIVLAVVIFLLGVVFYSFVAGIAGATVSRVEDTQEGMKLFTMVSIIGAYLSIFLIIMESSSGTNFGAFTNVVYLLPLSAPFIMPEYLILGKVSVLIGGISVLLLVVGIILMLFLVSNIYGALIYHMGAPLKIKDIIGITKERRSHK